MQLTMDGFVFWALYLVNCIFCICPVASNSIKFICNFLQYQNCYEVITLLHEINVKEVTNLTVSRVNGTNTEDAISVLPKIRTKRQEGGGKFTDAAKMPQVKVMRLLLQMISNSWATSYVGGAHPFHHEIPKAFVGLFKEKVVGYFMPSPGGDDKTT